MELKIDLYTKSVLTIIAIALVCLVFQNVNWVTPAHASTSTNASFGVQSPEEIETVEVRLDSHNITKYDPIYVKIVE